MASSCSLCAHPGTFFVNQFRSVQFSSVAQLCPTLCNPMNCSTPGLPVFHQLPEFTQTHVHQVHDAIQPSYPLSSSSPPAFNLSQHQGLFQWVGSSHHASVRNSTHGKGHEEGGFGICKGGIKPQETPCSQTSTPKTRVPALLFYALTYTSDFTGGWPPLTISLGEGVNLHLQLIKIPGRHKSVSTYKLLWRLSSLPERVRPATCDCLQPPNRERHEML